jgi:hypothetical protein
MVVRSSGGVTKVALYCWGCTLEMIATIKHYDWSQVPKSIRRSGWLLWNDRPLLKPPKVKAEL